MGNRDEGEFSRDECWGGGITGRGANLLIIDDPIRSREDANNPRFCDRLWDWWTNDVYTRLESGGTVIIIHTRWSDNDLGGRILQSDDAAQWTVVSLPAEAGEHDPLGRQPGEALWPERFSVDELASIKRVMGLDYYALYQQQPVSDEGGVYRKEWFLYDDHAPPSFEQVLQAWDTVSGTIGDYSACVTVGVAEGTAYIVDVWRAKLEIPDLINEVKRQAARWSPTHILIEDASSGTALQQLLKCETMLPILAVQPYRAGKIAHAQHNTPFWESGRVRLIRAPWNAAFVHELLGFGAGGVNDDQVDAANIALTRIFHSPRRRASCHSGWSADE